MSNLWSHVNLTADEDAMNVNKSTQSHTDAKSKTANKTIHHTGHARNGKGETLKNKH